MSKILHELLGVDKTKFGDYIERLERVCLRPGVDLRLGSEIITKTREKIRILGLDVSDTTSKELYFALKHKLSDDETKLQTKLDLKKGQVNKNTQKIAKTVDTLSGREKSLSLTSAGTKRILKAVPPKRTLKALKYRSLDSVLKREDPRVLYGLACLIENESWHSQVYAKIKRLNSKDIQWQHVSCLSVPEKWYEKLQNVLSHKGALFVNEETGVVCLMPVLDVSRVGSSVLMLGLALQATVSISTASLPYRRQALTQGYANILPRIAAGDHPEIASIHGLVPSWQVVHELVSKNQISIAGDDADFEVFEMFWESTETKLASLVDDMDFWVDSHYLGVATSNRSVSLHVLDVAVAAILDAPYGKQSVAHLESSLWNELQTRYLLEDILTRSLSDQVSKLTGTMLK